MRKHTIIVTSLLLSVVATAQQRGAFGLPGVAHPSEQVVISVPVEGVLQKLMVREGSTVEAGDPLAQLNDKVARAAVAAAKHAAHKTAALEHAHHELKLAMLKVDRLESVVGSGAVRALDLDEARARMAQASASVASAQEAQVQAVRNLELEKARLERLTIRAPFDGVVTRVDARAGATLTTQTPLVTLINLNTLRAELFVPVAHFAKLELGEMYDLQAGAPVSRTVGSRLTFVDPVLNSSTGTVRCLFEIANPGKELPAGLSVKLLGKTVPAAKPAKPAKPAGR